MGLKKTIGKMGALAKTGAVRAGQAVKSEYEQTKADYPETKRKVGRAINKADRLANRGLDYATRVRDNTSRSRLFTEPVESHGRHEESERFFMGPTYEQAEHKRKPQPKRGGQTIVIHVNNNGRRKKRKSKSKRIGFSLI